MGQPFSYCLSAQKKVFIVRPEENWQSDSHSIYTSSYPETTSTQTFQIFEYADATKNDLQSVTELTVIPVKKAYVTLTTVNKTTTE